MAPSPNPVLRPGGRKREVLGWARYDFANSGYTAVVITAVFAAYFVGGIAKGAPWAAFAWTAALSISYAIVMLTMPAIKAVWARHHSPAAAWNTFSAQRDLAPKALNHA